MRVKEKGQTSLKELKEGFEMAERGDVMVTESGTRAGNLAALVFLYLFCRSFPGPLLLTPFQLLFPFWSLLNQKEAEQVRVQLP